MTLKELRVAGLLPMMPLSVDILGADISEHALILYREQLESLEPVLAGVGISVQLTTRTWNAATVQQTNDVMDEYLAKVAAHNEYLVLVANFSGASKTLFTQFEESFKHFWIRLSSKASRHSSILWVEPKISEGRSLLSKLSKTVKSYNWFQWIIGKTQNYQECDYKFNIRMQDKTIPSGVRVHYYRRES
jgi:hypothetical protein